LRGHRTKVATLLGLDPKEMAEEMRARWNGKHPRWECREILGGRAGPWTIQRVSELSPTV